MNHSDDKNHFAQSSVFLIVDRGRSRFLMRHSLIGGIFLWIAISGVFMMRGIFHGLGDKGCDFTGSNVIVDRCSLCIRNFLFAMESLPKDSCNERWQGNTIPMRSDGHAEKVLEIVYRVFVCGISLRSKTWLFRISMDGIFWKSQGETYGRKCRWDKKGWIVYQPIADVQYNYEVDELEEIRKRFYR